MRSEKQRQRQREQQRRKRERRREHARQTLALLAGELDRPSLSGLLIDFAEPLRALCPEDGGREAPREVYEELLHVGALVWNAAEAYGGERLARELAGAAARLTPLTPAAPERVRSVLLQLAHRRRTRFLHEPRYIRGVEVLEEGGGEWRVLVASCLVPSDTEVRPSAVLDPSAEEHFIV